jgi:hypothetical protein
MDPSIHRRANLPFFPSPTRTGNDFFPSTKSLTADFPVMASSPQMPSKSSWI